MSGTSGLRKHGHTSAGDGGTISLSSSLGWFDVTDYGAIGDGSTDDTSAVNAAIAALNAASGGVLYLPKGTYKCTSALTTITAQATIMGDGGSGDQGHVYGTPLSEVRQTSATANLFTASAKGCVFRDLALANTAGSTPIAGAGISMSSGYFARVVRCTVSRFYDDISISDGAGWSIDDSFIHDPVRYGVRIQGSVSPDSGDQSIVGCYFMAENQNGTAAIRYESAGGLKIANCKINNRGTPTTGKFVDGLSLAVPSSVATAVLHVANSSIENVSGDGIHGATSSGISTFKLITITGVQIALYSNNTGRAVNLIATTASDFSDVVIAGCNFRTDGTARAAISLTKCDNVVLSALALSGFNAAYTSSSSTNITDLTAAGSVTFVTPAIVLGTAAAAGAASTAIRSDATIVAFDGTNPAAVGTTGTGAAAVAARRDHVHATGASTPTTLAFSDAAATGSGPAAAMTDHRHGMPADPGSGSGGLLIADSPSTPLVFADLIQNEAQDDLLYADT